MLVSVAHHDSTRGFFSPECLCDSVKVSSLLHEVFTKAKLLSEPDFYGDLVYKLKKIVGSNNFLAQFIKIISHSKKIAITLMYCNRLHAW